MSRPRPRTTVPMALQFAGTLIAVAGLDITVSLLAHGELVTWQPAVTAVGILVYLLGSGLLRRFMGDLERTLGEIEARVRSSPR